MNLSPTLSSQSATGLAGRSSNWATLRFLARNRYQLLGALLWAIILPVTAGDGLQLSGREGSGTGSLAIAMFACIVVGAFVRRQLGAFPKSEGFSQVLLSFGAAYGVVGLSFFLMNPDHSKGTFLLSFVAALAWFYFVSLVEARGCRPCFLLVPRGDATDLLHNDKADWRIALTPDETVPHLHGVVADLYAQHDAAWQRFLENCALKGLPVYHSRQMKEQLTGRVTINHLSENNLGSVLPTSIYMRFKRLADLIALVIIAPIAAAVCLAAAVMIKLDDGGPVLFRQKRRGFHGETFMMLKFRTMRVDPSNEAKAFTDENDPRITRVGRILRRYRIDELPQLVNILRGEMSWSGPRPEALSLAEWYEAEIPYYAYRHMVRPGITGWAQVNQGNVAEIDDASVKLEYDFYYIRNISIWLELLILIRTVRTILTGFGAR